jgi:rhamnulokinase
MPHDYLAIDLGASSGRAVIGSFDGSKLSLREVHRFVNGPISLATGLHWDTPRLFGEIKKSLALARQAGAKLSGIGIDTWGVDYGLLSHSGELLAPPHHYRDPRTHGQMERAFARVSRDRIYAITGIQFMPINTLYQLLADQQSPGGGGGAEGKTLLDRACTLLFMPDLLHYWLTGVRRSERSIASTSQMLDTRTGQWSADILDALALPSRILPDVSPPGSILGPLLPQLAEEFGQTDVIVPASHDTASAVAAVPAPPSPPSPPSQGSDWAYISSGTWSLVGRELAAPNRTPAAMAANFTNECGVNGTIRFHKNVAGLWLLQECHRVWTERGGKDSIATLCDKALAEPPFAFLIDPDDPALSEYGDMPGLIRNQCLRAAPPRPPSPVPSTEPAIVRCILDSLALKYRAVLDALESLTGPVRTIHIVGGGVNNRALCQFTANACQRPVIAGPVEATASGNAMVQALAHGRVTSLSDIRAVIAASFRVDHYQPVDDQIWTDAYERFQNILKNERASAR